MEESSLHRLRHKQVLNYYRNSNGLMPQSRMPFEQGMQVKHEPPWHTLNRTLQMWSNKPPCSCDRLMPRFKLLNKHSSRSNANVKQPPLKMSV